MKITGIPSNYDDYDHPRYIWRTAQLCLNHQPNGFVETALKWMQGPLVKLIDAFKPSYPSHFKVLWNIGESILWINPSTHHAHQANECHCKLQAQNWQSKSNSHEDQDPKIYKKNLETLKKVQSCSCPGRSVPFLFGDIRCFWRSSTSGCHGIIRICLPYFRS